MELKVLKQNIENKTVSDEPIVFKISENDFIATQYYREIARIKNLTIKCVENLGDIHMVTHSMWEIPEEYLYVLRVDKFEEEDLHSYKNLIVITSKTSYPDVVEIPKLEPLQIQSYIKVRCPGFKENTIQYLCEMCGNDIYAIEQELERFGGYDSRIQNKVFGDFVRDGGFSHKSTKSIFDLSNAILAKNIPTVSSILNQIKSMDVEPLGLVTILYNNFNKLIQVWCTRNPSSSNTSLTDAQIWAIKKQPMKYTYEQLKDAFKLCCKMDYMLKNGKINENQIVDYLIVNLLI